MRIELFCLFYFVLLKRVRKKYMKMRNVLKEKNKVKCINMYKLEVVRIKNKLIN